MDSNESKSDNDGFWPEWWKGPKVVKSDAEFDFEVREKLAEERRQNHHVDKLLKKDGFYSFNTGPEDGVLYFVNNGKLCEIEFCEYGSIKEPYSMDISLNLTTHWIRPSKNLITPDELKQVKEALSTWLTEKKIRHNLDDKIAHNGN